jgi:hypothetical protein
MVLAKFVFELRICAERMHVSSHALAEEPEQSVYGVHPHLGHAHVPQLHIEAVVEKNVERLDVAVQDLARMHVIQPQQDLRHGIQKAR